MKAILVIDLPKSCWACPLWDKSDYADGCEAVGRKTHDIDHGTEREVWCPLKPMPEAKENKPIPKGQTHYQWVKNKHEIIGWNDCLKEIKE